MRYASKMNADKLKHAEERLHALRADLLLQKEQTAEDKAPVELDQVRLGRLSRMDAMQQQAMALELDRRRDVQLKRIEGAFLRLEKGTYGECARCNERIDEKRMDNDPTVFFCIACARQVEKR